MRTSIRRYEDDRGNSIDTSLVFNDAFIDFKGKNNRVYIDSNAKIRNLSIVFAGDNGVVNIGSGGEIKLSIRVGYDALISIGNGLTCTSTCYITAVEGGVIEIGDDCMFASANELRSDDGHPIFDLVTGDRINFGGSIKVGNHVWLGARSVILGTASIENGCVIGHSAVVKSNIPANCIAVGVPAKVVRKNIRWERPHLSLNKNYKTQSNF